MEHKIDFDSKELHPMTANLKQLRARLAQMDLEMLREYKAHHGNLGKNLNLIVAGLIYSKTPRGIETEDDRVDGDR